MTLRRCVDPELIIPISRHSSKVNKTGTWGIRRPRHEEKASPCRVACPAGNNIPAALYRASLGDFDGALAAFLEENPLPGTCGRVCYHTCEGECNRGEWDGAVHIRALERAASDWGTARPVPLTDAGRDLPVAVVGSGPAGLSAAYHLARMGHPVTLVEAEESLGGLLRWGIPRYRLPLEALEKDLERILSLDIQVRTGTRLDRLLLEKLCNNHEAVFLALGAQRDLHLGITGEELEGVHYAVNFLKEVQQEPRQIEGRVVVIGGGNVAIDAALTALRLGARRVDLVCLEQRHEMPADERECLDALEEGVVFHNGWGPRTFSGRANRVTGIEFIRCLSVLDAEGAFRPAYDNATAMVLQADLVLLAVGRAPDLSILEGQVSLDKDSRGGPKVEAESLQTSIRGIYAGGDLVNYPGSVVGAIAAGKRAALSIHQTVLGRSFEEAEARVLLGSGNSFSIHALFHERPGWHPEMVVRFDGMDPIFLDSHPRADLPRLSPGDRLGNFREINQSLSRSDSKELAGRCFFCGTCTSCDRCFLYCPELSILPPGEDRFVYTCDPDYCKGCAVCVDVCPGGVMSMDEAK
ncbi:MAG: FAD-dependent oxidoreductase [Deltaproteobacteria bacterium]|nr:FAD-dependent oxidoreductase [Deltaproteobacteria bacterium]